MAPEWVNDVDAQHSPLQALLAQVSRGLFEWGWQAAGGGPHPAGILITDSGKLGEPAPTLMYLYLYRMLLLLYLDYTPKQQIVLPAVTQKHTFKCRSAPEQV